MITASEIARYLFCARALWYDYQNPDLRSPSVVRLFRRWIASPVAIGVSLLSLAAIVLLTSPLIAAVSAGVGLLLYILLRILWQRLRNPPQQVLYLGVKAQRNSKTFTASEFGLSGKPDYLIKTEGQVIPLLNKTNPAPQIPHQAHVMQVVAHCLLVAENLGTRPPFGVIRYGDGRTFEVDFDEDSVEALSQTMDDIEAIQQQPDAPRNHDQRARCYACMHRERCEESLF